MRYLKTLCMVVLLVLLATYSPHAQFVHSVSGTSVTLTCSNTTGTAYATDIFTELLTGNTTFTLPAAATNCVNRSHIELFITQATNNVWTATTVRGAGTLLAFPVVPQSPLTATTTAGTTGVLPMPISTAGATDVTLHQIWIYDTRPTTPEWKLVTQETNPAPLSAIVSPCVFSGTADVQINAAQTSLTQGGIIDARCYGGTTVTVAAPITISPGTGGTTPTAFLFDSATTFNCTINNPAQSCWNVGSSGSMIGVPGGVNGKSPNAGFALASTGNVQAIITNVPASTTFVLEGAFIVGSSGTIGKGALWLNAPLQPVVIKAVSIGGTPNAVLEFISNDGGSAIGPIEEYDPNIDCNNAVGCVPLKIGPPTTSNVFSGMTFVGGLFNHPGATKPAIDVEASGAFGNPTSISFIDTLIEGNSIATTPTGFLLNGGNGIAIINPQSSVGGTDFIKIQNVGAAAPANITITNSSNPGGWTNNVHNVLTGYIDTSFNVPYYSYNGTVENHIVLEDSSSKKTTLGANALTLGGTLQYGVAVATPGAAATATLNNTGGSGPATAAQNSWQPIKLSDGTTAWIPVWK